MNWPGGAEKVTYSSTEEELLVEKMCTWYAVASPVGWSCVRSGGAVVGSKPTAGGAPDREDSPLVSGRGLINKYLN